jgi:hypothetical protein
MLRLLYIVFIIIVLAWLYFSYFKNRTLEGFSLTTSSGGIAGGAEQFSTTLKEKTIKLMDTLLIQKYRTDYEHCIVNLDDYINALMLQASLQINIATDLPLDEKNLKIMESINTLNATKQSLNSIIKFIDSV